MSVWAFVPFLPLVLSAPVGIMLARLLRRRRPQWSRAKLSFFAAIPSCMIILLLSGCWIASVGLLRRAKSTPAECSLQL
jgi:hypothetical protein